MIPIVSPPRPLKVPSVLDERLPNGMRVVVARRHGAPLLEVRVRVPMVASTMRGEATRDLLARTITAGTRFRSRIDIEVHLQSMGATLFAFTDEDGLRMSGSVPSGRAKDFIALLAEILRTPTFPGVPTRAERRRLAEEVVLALAQPGVVAENAFRRRFFGRHPYGLGLPSPSAVTRVTGTTLRAAHHDLSSRAVLTVVGDLPSRRVFEIIREQQWIRRRRSPTIPPIGEPVRRPLQIVHREGAQQTNIRIGGRAPAGDASFDVTNLVFGGYFLSRLVKNLREEKGLTYNAHSRLHHALAASTVTISADVRTEATGEAITEITSELSRLATSPPGEDELANARRYAMGVLSIRAHTKSGLADLADSLMARGLDLTYLRSYQKELATVTPDDVLESARQFLMPSRLTTVMVGDADRIVSQVEHLGRVVVR